ncbi:uncharacterized protein LOC120352331 [Nilaparvata lugens]|uniref:uncharacterized protein LOC120352331 n=1 Tax=Nilaparvata lugens TaxID=108931 RepID=UPI00193D902D|nr:uncharacterized protein LOC120352331 [Nilaparvata lugens]XP_039288308.1 uncharacterized protein LOC120352331 [Nilaparvata lugens]
MLNDSSTDTKFGPRLVRNKYYLGSRHLTFGSDDSKIELTDPTDEEHKMILDATAGLCELIFKKKPNNQLVTSPDSNAYKHILYLTKLYRKNYDPVGHIIHSNDVKYKKTIYPLIRNGKHGGRGLVTPFNMVANDATEIEYIYHNNPNELVDRLRLLDQSRAVGNTGHENEIISILEELVEGGYIVGKPAH